ncbi:MAG: ABC transporter ATP-binding protein [Actinobacteria bacterium]|nr:ABC transporter ATP-binding protein [Actinomycetota bacterium]
MTRRGLRLIGRSVREHPLPFTLAMLGSGVFALMSVASTIVLGRVTDTLIVPAFRERHTTGRAITGAAVAILAVATLRALGVIGRRWFAGMAAARMQRSWRQWLTGVYLRAPVAFHRSRPTGELMAHVDNDVEAATDALNPVPFGTSALLIAVVAFARLLIVDPVLALVAAAVFPALAVLNRVYADRVERPAELVQARFGDVAAVTHESFDGVLAVKTLGLGDRESARLAGAADRLRRERLRTGQLRAMFEPMFDLIPNLGTIAVLGIGSWRVSSGAVSTGALVEAMALFGVLAVPVRVAGFVLEELPRAVVSAERLDGVLATEPAPQPDRQRAAALPDAPLSVQVEHVRFGYEPGAPVLDDLTVDVAPGEVVALVGSTGSGKSTLCDLLVRLDDPSDGTVRLGGVDLRTADPASVAAATALVFQETFLFADTLRENLTFGEPVGDDELRRAVRTARAERFIERLPAGLDTVVGERGVTLSGGQRQRIALARALARRPRLLILDDATSAVDPRIEQEILHALRTGLDTTCVVVAHRVATIALADRVLLLDGGRISATGTHADLLARVPAYEALVRAYEQRAAEEPTEDDDERPDEDALASADGRRIAATPASAHRAHREAMP